MVTAIGFDLGDTLIRYEGVPLNWSSMYRDALVGVALACGFVWDEQMIVGAQAILAKYNTRLNPRTHEVTSEIVIGEVLQYWGLSLQQYIQPATDAFFSFFQRTSSVYEDAIPTLRRLKAIGLRVGVLTDVPYGMGWQYVARDLAPIAEHLDAVLTSVDTGFRKPDPRGYTQLASRLNTDPGHMIYVGNEPKDIIGAKAAGLATALIDRDSTLPPMDENHRIHTLSKLIEIISQPK